MSAKGVVHTPNFVTERVLAAIAAISNEEFDIQDVRAQIPDLTARQVSHHLWKQANRGSLDRIGIGRYRKGGVRIHTKLAPGLLAEAVWAVLATNPDQRPLRLPDIAGEAESYLSRPGYSASKTVATLLSIWHRDGYLERSGKCGEYAYTIKPDVTERPLASS